VECNEISRGIIETINNWAGALQQGYPSRDHIFSVITELELQSSGVKVVSKAYILFQMVIVWRWLRTAEEAAAFQHFFLIETFTN
jgi:hypothetical protein